MVKDCFKISIELNDNFVNLTNISHFPNQEQTNKIFSEKWNVFEEGREKERLYDFQKNWYLQLMVLKMRMNLETFEYQEGYFRCRMGLGYKAFGLLNCPLVLRNSDGFFGWVKELLQNITPLII